MQAEMHSQARPLPRFEPARELRLARMCRSRRHVPREAPRSRTRVTTRRARKSRPRYSGRYAHARNAMRSAPKCSCQECYAKCTNRCALIEMFHVRGEHTVHISNVRRYGKFMQFLEHLRIMQYYEHLRGLAVCYHCACTAASQEVRNRTFARCFPQKGGKGPMMHQQKASVAALGAAAKCPAATSTARGSTAAKRGKR